MNENHWSAYMYNFRQILFIFPITVRDKYLHVLYNLKYNSTGKLIKIQTQ